MRFLTVCSGQSAEIEIAAWDSDMTMSPQTPNFPKLFSLSPYTCVTFSEYLEEIVLYCERKNKTELRRRFVLVLCDKDALVGLLLS